MDILLVVGEDVGDLLRLGDVVERMPVAAEVLHVSGATVVNVRPRGLCLILWANRKNRKEFSSCLSAYSGSNW